MMQKTSLEGMVSGQGYDTRLVLYFAEDSERKVLFDYWIYRLFSSEESELRLNLNFGTNKFLPHALRRIGESLALIPRFTDRLHSHMNGLPVFDWEKYLELVAPHVFIFPIDAWDDACTRIGLSLEGLPHIASVTAKDVLSLWLVASGFRPTHPPESFIPAYGMALAKSILAEHPASRYSVKKILLDMLRGEVAIESSTFCATEEDHVITAYLLAEDDSTHEWSALLVNNHTYVLLERFPVKLPDYSEY